MKYLGIIISTLAAITWGFVYANTEKVLEKMSPISSVALFYYLGAIILLPFLLSHRQDMIQGALLAPKELIFTTVMILLAEFFIMWSISLLGGTEAALIEVSYPIWTAIFLYFLSGKEISFNTFIGGIFIFTGVIFISLAENSK